MRAARRGESEKSTHGVKSTGVGVPKPLKDRKTRISACLVEETFRNKLPDKEKQHRGLRIRFNRVTQRSNPSKECNHLQT